MSDTVGDRTPELTPTQSRFLDVVESHVHEEKPGDDGWVKRKGIYVIKDSFQAFPFLGGVTFAQSISKGEDGEALDSASVIYEDSREGHEPWMDVSLYFDLDCEIPEILGGRDGPFSVCLGLDSHFSEDDIFAAEIIKTVALLEANGMLVREDANPRR